MGSLVVPVRPKLKFNVAAIFVLHSTKNTVTNCIFLEYLLPFSLSCLSARVKQVGSHWKDFHEI
jgi:hypothetical protein